MANYQFNGATFTMGTLLEDAGMQSFSLSGGDRSEIDVTTSASTRRQSIAGFKSPRRLDVSLIYDGELTAAELETAMSGCNTEAVTIKVSASCAAPAQFISFNVHVMNYSITGDLDGVLMLDVSMMVDE